MKRIIAFLLLMIFLLTASVFAQDDMIILDEDGTEETENYVVLQEHLTVGSPTPMDGKFFTEMWEDVTSDGDVRSLIHAYNLVMWDGERGAFAHDPSVVNAMGIMDNEEGDRAFLIALHDNLYFSNGLLFEKNQCIYVCLYAHNANQILG